MLPAAWFAALERADGPGLFAETSNLLRYGFVSAEGASELNAMGLPIGFALDPEETPEYGKFLGLTCAACHTANVSVEGRVIRIDGAPAHLDFDRFYEDLARSFGKAVVDAAAFGRFARRILGEASPEEIARLRGRFVALATRLAGDQAIRAATLESGHGRVDALTQIINALAVTAQESPSNLRRKVAPTSYPALWLTPQLEFVQWNPIAASPIGRNVGEVLGVFGTTALTGQREDWFQSSALIPQLHALEQWIAELSPPSWDESILGPIDMSLAERGEGAPGLMSHGDDPRDIMFPRAN